jgi:hypothetical protein
VTKKREELKEGKMRASGYCGDEIREERTGASMRIWTRPISETPEGNTIQKK